MKYVFETGNLKRYSFPTHINDLVIDRADAATSEVFVVIVGPGKATHLHRHDDIEQIFYVVEGEGALFIGPDKKKFKMKPAQVVKIPPKTLHTVKAVFSTGCSRAAKDPCFMRFAMRAGGSIYPHPPAAAFSPDVSPRSAHL